MIDLCLAIFLAALTSQEHPASAVTVHETIVVTAERGEEERDRVPAATSILSRAAIEALPASSAAELIDFLPGVTVLLTGQGGRPMITSRGFFGGGEVEYVQLLVDGVPADDAESGLADWNAIPPEAIERIEFLHGPASAIYGDTALAGVVEIFTRPASGSYGGIVTLEAGSFDTREAVVSWRGSGRFDSGISARAATTDGFRSNSASDRFFAEGFLGRGAGSVDAGLRLSASSLRRDDPGFLPLDAIDDDPRASDDLFSFDRDDSDRLSASLDLAWSAPFPLRLLLYALDRDTSLVRTILLAPGFGDRAFRDTSTRTFGASAIARFEGTLFGRPAALRTGADVARDSIDVGYFAVSAGGAPEEALAAGEGTREEMALFATNQWEVGERLQVTAGLRYDRLRDTFADRATHDAWSPRLGVNIRFGRTDTPPYVAFAQASRAFKAPTVDQLFDPRPFPDFTGGRFTISNPELVPQRAVNLEAGLSRLSPAVAWSLAVYLMEVEDEIDFDVATFRYRNIGESLHEGVEASAEWRAARFSPRLAYTWTRVEPQSGPHRGNQLKNIPEHVVQIGARADLPAAFTLDASLQWMTGWYLDDGNTIAIDDSTRVDLRLRKAFGDWSGRVDLLNALDDVVAHTGVVLPDFEGGQVGYAYPSTGRSVSIAVERRF